MRLLFIIIEYTHRYTYVRIRYKRKDDNFVTELRFHSYRPHRWSDNGLNGKNKEIVINKLDVESIHITETFNMC